MATHIKQIDDEERQATVLLVTGEMFYDDAVFIERIASEATEISDRRVIVDLADLDYLDSEAASVLRRLSLHRDISIDGIEIFLQTVINEAERNGS